MSQDEKWLAGLQRLNHESPRTVTLSIDEVVEMLCEQTDIHRSQAVEAAQDILGVSERAIRARITEKAKSREQAQWERQRDHEVRKAEIKRLHEAGYRWFHYGLNGEGGHAGMVTACIGMTAKLAPTAAESTLSLVGFSFCSPQDSFDPIEGMLMSHQRIVDRDRYSTTLEIYAEERDNLGRAILNGLIRWQASDYGFHLPPWLNARLLVTQTDAFLALRREKMRLRDERRVRKAAK